jgi:AbiV family abortive infection protein
MKAKACKDLAQLADGAFLEQVAEGMSLVLANAQALFADAKVLAEAGRKRSADLLETISAEEAAKYLILLDAVRCPKAAPELPRQLGYFNSHLAKGIYAAYYNTRPATFGDSLYYIAMHRHKLYLDGPNDVDWIFRNWLLQEREERIYVDYIDSDEGHSWLSPLRFEQIVMCPASYPPAALRVATALDSLGFTAPGALGIIADTWTFRRFSAASHWQECEAANRATLDSLYQNGSIKSTEGTLVREALGDWLFPLWSVDLGLIETNVEELRERQRQWVPDF